MSYAIFGTMIIPMPSLLLAIDIFMQAYDSELARETDFAARTIYTAWFDRAGNISSPFHDLLSRLTEVSKATDERDLVYAFLGLQSEPKIDIYPDYAATIETVFADTAAAIIRGTCSLDIFCTLSEYEIHSSPSIPSWSPDWRRTKKCFGIHARSGLSHPSRMPKACQGRPHIWIDSGQRNLLAVRGNVIDVVKKNLASPFSMHTQTWQELNISDYLNLNAIFEMNKNWRFVSGQDLTKVRLLRTILADSAMGNTFPTKFPGLDLQNFEALLKAYQSFTDKEPSASLNPTTLQEAYTTGIRYLSYVANNRSVFMSSEGKLGLASKVKEGDLICILHGSVLPVLLRPDSPGKHIVLESCYFEDAMKGEAVTWKEDEATEFVLI